MSSDARQDDDVASMLFAEEGEGGFDEVDLAEEQDFELVADEVLGGERGGEFFYGSNNCYNNPSVGGRKSFRCGC
jgi:hypothetical protein